MADAKKIIRALPTCMVLILLGNNRNCTFHLHFPCYRQRHPFLDSGNSAINHYGIFF